MILSSSIGEIGFLGGIALTAYGLSELVKNNNKQVGSLEIFVGIGTIIISSSLKTPSKTRKKRNKKVRTHS